MESIASEDGNGSGGDVEQASGDNVIPCHRDVLPQKNERPRSTSAVDGGRLNPSVQVGTPRGIWEEADTAASSYAS